MDFGKTLKSPIVWGGGALIGIVLLFKAPAPIATPTIAHVGNTAATNVAAYGAQVELARIQADTGGFAFQADTAKTIGFYRLLESYDNNNRMMQMQRDQSRAGITQAIIQGNTAILVDQSNNAGRLGLAQQETWRSQIGANRDVETSRYQYLGQKAAAKAATIGAIAGAVTQAAKTAAMFA